MTKLTISLVYHITQRLLRSVLQLVGGSRDPKLVVLYYHGIPDAHRSSFLRQMQAIGRGARVVPASHSGNLPSGKPNVAITFDDAYVTVAENALPELASRGFHSTIFTPIEAAGSGPTWPMEAHSLDSQETIMSAERISTLPSSLVEIGSHTCTHPRLSRLPPCDAEREIEGSRIKIQNLTKQEVRLLAFPYGDYDETTIELCKRAGYDYVFGTTPTPVNTASSAFLRGRVRVDPTDWPLEFFLKYNGAYAWIAHVSSLKRRLKYHNQSRALHGFSFRQRIPRKQPERS